MRLTLPVSVAFLSVLLTSSTAVEVVAHRGASSEAPENTVVATKLAYDQGADGVECDIYATADGRIAVIHDKDTKRTTGVSGLVEKMTLAELQKLDAGLWKSPTYAGEKIPSLEALLEVIPPGRRLVVEMKGGTELLPGISAALKAVPKAPDAVEFIAFSYETLRETKKLFPERRALWLLSYKVDKESGKPTLDIQTVIERCKAANFDGVSLSKTWPINAVFIKSIRDAGLDVYVWTINDVNEARKLAEAGMPVICTDKPAVMHELFKSK
jgi:glycerophosphoryl diester phosphodiesterase